MIAAPVSFDRQAGDFDLRAGLPPGVARSVAAALGELAPRLGGVLLDLGAGTGQLGRHLAGGRFRYLGMDLSGPMLAVFRRKLGARAALVRGDAAAPWPIASGRVELVFVSRAAHLFPAELLVEEALRVGRSGGALLVLGGVSSPPDSLRAVLRRKMRALLAEHGVEARRAGDARARIAAAVGARGGDALGVRTAAEWTTIHRAIDAVAAWRAKSGLGGQAVPPELQERVLGRLEDWIRERYGGREVESEAIERYELAAFRLPSRFTSNHRERASDVRRSA